MPGHLGGGRIDAWAAANYLGLVPATPPPATPAVTPATTPTSSRQVLLTDGVVRKRAVIRLQLAAGPLYLQLIGRSVAADCGMSFRAAGTLYVDLPAAVELTISQTDPGVQGDRSTGGTKPATLETGATIQVPLFISTGEKIKVDTRTGQYLGRA